MTFADEVTADSPELWWDTRQAVGTAQPDRSGNGHTGTLLNGPTLDAVNGVLFDGSSDQRVLSNATVEPIGSIPVFAVEAVINMTSAAFRNVAGFTDNNTNDYLNLTADPEPDFAYNASNQANGPDPIPTGVLTHVMGTYDGSDLKVFVNGVEEGSTAIAADDAVFTAAQKFAIGNDDYGPGDDFLGNIKHALWYRSAPSPTRVAAHAAAITNDPPGGGTPPSVDSLTPSSGTTAGGTEVVIAGSDFTDTTDVDFGATPAASFVEDSDSQITAISPAHAAGTVQVIVTTPNGSSG